MRPCGNSDSPWEYRPGFLNGTTAQEKTLEDLIGVTSKPTSLHVHVDRIASGSTGSKHHWLTSLLREFFWDFLLAFLCFLIPVFCTGLSVSLFACLPEAAPQPVPKPVCNNISGSDGSRDVDSNIPVASSQSAGLEDVCEGVDDDNPIASSHTDGLEGVCEDNHNCTPSTTSSPTSAESGGLRGSVSEIPEVPTPSMHPGWDKLTSWAASSRMDISGSSSSGDFEMAEFPVLRSKNSDLKSYETQV